MGSGVNSFISSQDLWPIAAVCRWSDVYVSVFVPRHNVTLFSEDSGTEGPPLDSFHLCNLYVRCCRAGLLLQTHFL